MENIGFFLSGCEAYGCEKGDLFQTVDLYEKQNMPQVSILYKFQFPFCLYIYQNFMLKKYLFVIVSSVS